MRRLRAYIVKTNVVRRPTEYHTSMKIAENLYIISYREGFYYMATPHEHILYDNLDDPRFNYTTHRRTYFRENNKKTFRISSCDTYYKFLNVTFIVSFGDERGKTEVCIYDSLGGMLRSMARHLFGPIS